MKVRPESLAQFTQHCEATRESEKTFEVDPGFGEPASHVQVFGPGSQNLDAYPLYRYPIGSLEFAQPDTLGKCHIVLTSCLGDGVVVAIITHILTSGSGAGDGNQKNVICVLWAFFGRQR